MPAEWQAGQVLRFSTRPHRRRTQRFCGQPLRPPMRPPDAHCGIFTGPAVPPLYRPLQRSSPLARPSPAPHRPGTLQPRELAPRIARARAGSSRAPQAIPMGRTSPPRLTIRGAVLPEGAERHRGPFLALPQSAARWISNQGGLRCPLSVTVPRCSGNASCHFRAGQACPMLRQTVGQGKRPLIALWSRPGAIWGPVSGCARSASNRMDAVLQTLSGDARDDIGNRHGPYRICHRIGARLWTGSSSVVSEQLAREVSRPDCTALQRPNIPHGIVMSERSVGGLCHPIDAAP